MDKFLVLGGAGRIVLPATAQMNAKRAARRLELNAALKAAFQAYDISLFPHVKPARRPRDLEKAADKFVAIQANSKAEIDALNEDVNAWAMRTVQGFFARRQGSFRSGNGASSHHHASSPPNAGIGTECHVDESDRDEGVGDNEQSTLSRATIVRARLPASARLWVRVWGQL
jgi:hypothetical protein